MDVRPVSARLRLTFDEGIILPALLDTLDLPFLLRRNNKQVRKLLEELILRLPLEAIFQILIQHVHDLHNDVFVLLIYLGLLWLVAAILLLQFRPLLVLIAVLFELSDHLVLHEVLNCNQLINLKILLAVFDLWLLHLGVIFPRVDEIAEVLHGHARFHGCVEVVDGVQAEVVACCLGLFITLLIPLIVAIHLIN